MGQGPAIRARRLALGRSLEDVSAATRIPVQHLESLEEDRPEDLPAGPYAAVWLRAVRRWTMTAIAPRGCRRNR